jgi:pimeloyl-ACP methyl ester carboxylesterase
VNAYQPPQTVHANGIDICYETFGNDSAEPLLLIMGLGAQMIHWDDAFCEQLAAHGFRVVRFDNRDIGKSSHLTGGKRLTPLELLKLRFLRIPVAATYKLIDMAKDTVGLMDALGIKSAHLVGASMGGMIAQEVTLSFPERVRSLTSIMSTTGRRTVGFPNPKVYPMLLSSTGRTRDSYVARSLKGSKVIGSPAFPSDDVMARDRAYETYDRGWTASGVTRQMLAVLTQGDRTAALGELDLPALVIHGLNDPLVHKSGGKATADEIPGAEHLEIAGMAHDMPAQLYSTYIDAIERTAARVSTAEGS